MGRQGTRTAAFVETLTQIGVHRLHADFKMAEPAARDAMDMIARELCRVYGRLLVYIPANAGQDLNERDQRLWEAYGQPGPDGARPYTGERIEQLAAEAKLTTVHLYRIFKFARQRAAAERAKSDGAGGVA